MPLLLDSFAALRLLNGDPFGRSALTAIEAASGNNEPILVSPVTAWEMAELIAHKRVQSRMPPEVWFSSLLELPCMTLAPMPPEILMAAASLPARSPENPALRIIAATARQYGYCVVTRNRSLLAYARAGQMDVLPC